MIGVLKRLRVFWTKFIPFKSSADYWDKRYRFGGTSGQGSYDLNAEFKATELNKFIREHGIGSVIEFGCGDGNQLKMIVVDNYLGLDVSRTAVNMCKEKFDNDKTKKFLSISEYSGQQAELSLSLDVIFHLVEDEVFENYMKMLFVAGKRFTIVYSSNSSKVNYVDRSHVKHRKFTDWVQENVSEFRLLKEIPTTIKGKEGSKTALKSFFIYQRI
ncbi:MAG: hypothetical protein RIC15_06530 [Vicingaceae bacterium]